MSAGPADAALDGDGFRWYEWAEPGKEPVRVLSVSSISSLVGTSYGLVRWQISNIVNAATGMTRREWVGPRGGHNEGYFPETDGVGEFVARMMAADTDAKRKAVREWLVNSAEKPRDIAAIRGTIVHESIEKNVRMDRIDEAYLAAAVDRLSQRDKAKVKKHGGVTDDDVAFVRHCNAQYWDLRASVPFVTLAKEPQVWNLTAGYAGSADVLIWFLGDWVLANDAWAFVPLPGIGPSELKHWQKEADAGRVTQQVIAEVGGEVELGDWKTAKGLYTDNVIQVTAYQAAEFVGSKGLVDERLTALLNATSNAAIIHIRPSGWGIHFTPFRADVLRAFLGRVANARFLATFKEPDELFTHEVSGAARVEEEDAA